MKNYKLIVAYDGTRYLGWQKLGERGSAQYARTIQGKLEGILSRMTGEAIEIHGSGRTDAGVHALGQIASFKTGFETTPAEITAYLNRYLPEDIAVTAAEEASERFHARLNAKEKTYRYSINTSAVPDVFRHRYEYQLEAALDIEKMRAAAALLVGTHDFRPFCSSKRTKKSTVRTVYAVEITPEDKKIAVTFRGSGFLYNMVRILVGTLIEIGRGDRPPEDIPAIFEGRLPAGYTAPAKGLTLLEVVY